MMRPRNGLCAVLLATLGTAAFALATFRSGHNEAPAARDLQQDSSQPLTRFAVEVPLLDCDGTPCVEASIGSGRQGKWGIDTGNVDSVVDAKVADEAGLKPSQPPRPGTPSGMFRTTIPVLHIGALTLESIGALRMDLSEMISQKQMPHVAGRWRIRGSRIASSSSISPTISCGSPM
jgi:hypothetical protein